MTEKSEFFSSFIDIERRASFSLDHEISPDNFKELVGEYRLDEDVACQVKAKNGICHQKHKNGWLGVTKDGFEVLIGGHCARNYFKADKTFAFERKRVRKEIDRKKAIHKLKEYRENVLTFSSELAELRKKIIDTRVKLDQILKLFPNSVLTFITNAQRTRNWDINVDLLKEYDGDKKSTWVVSHFCKLRPLPYMHEVITLMNKVKNLSEVYGEACKINPDEIKTPKLKRVIETLNEKSDLEKLGTLLNRDVYKFLDVKNLESLIYICDDKDDEYLTTKAIMTVTDAKVSTDGHINLRLRRIKERTEKQFGGQKIRKNQIIDKFQRQNIFAG